MASDDDEAWPAAAASRVRVRIDGCGGGDGNDGAGRLCRLHPDPSSGTVDLVECLDGEVTLDPPEIYEESGGGRGGSSRDGGIDLESYLSVSDDRRRHAADSFRPRDAVSVRLSLEYSADNPNTFMGMRSCAVARILVHAYPKDGSGRRTAGHRSYALDPRCCEDLADVRSVLAAVRRLAGLDEGPGPARLLVILNPFSGGGGPRSRTGARRVYEETVRPMLEGAGVEHDALVTAHGGHARERMGRRRSRDERAEGDESPAEEIKPEERDPLTTDDELHDISEYDGVVAMGGDGILFEILQGARDRPDSSSVLSKVKFGIVPCGTFNGLAKSLSHWGGDGYGALESAFRICRGRASTLDIAEYDVLPKCGGDGGGGDSPATKPVESYLSFLSYSWGLIADCDIESESLRLLGPLRSDVWAVYRGLLCRRRYRARFAYLPPGAAPDGKAVMPEGTRDLPEGWRVVEDDLLVFWVCNTSHAAHNMFTCPAAGMDDGLFHVLVVR